jgi:phosphoglycerate dehydrogenase-like enzyme
MLEVRRMTVHCAILDDYQQVSLALADWSRIADKAEVRAISRHIDSEEELAEEIGDCEIVVIMRERTPFRESMFKRLPRLKLLVTTGMRNASVDLAAATASGVTVCGTGGAAHATAELTWALLLGLARHITAENNAFRSNGPWQSTVGVDLHGKQLGLLGLGKLGSQVARIGHAFGMRVCAWSQNLTQEHAESVGVRLAASKAELLENSDFVSIHLVLGDRTRGLLGREDLRRMKRTAFLLNTSRAPIVDRSALIEALQNGWIAGAGMDVYETEPLPADDILRTLPNVLATPHIGYVSQMTYDAFFQGALEDIQAYLEGAPVRRLN